MRRLFAAPLLALLLASPVAAASPSPAPTPAPPDPACPTGFVPGSTADDDGDSCYFISGTVLSDGQPLAGATVTAKIVPTGGDEPAIGSYASTTGDDGNYRLGVLPGYRWRVLLRTTPDAEPQLINLSTGASQSEDAVFNISAEGRIVLLILIDGEGTVRGDFDSVVLQVLTPTPPPAQYNPLERGAEQAVRLPYDQVFLDELAAVDAAQRSADPITLVNLFLGSAIVVGLAIFALRLNSAPHSIAEHLGKQRRKRADDEADSDSDDNPFSYDD